MNAHDGFLDNNISNTHKIINIDNIFICVILLY